MGLRDRLSTVRDYVLASFIPASDHPGRGGMTGEATEQRGGKADDETERPTEDGEE